MKQLALDILLGARPTLDNFVEGDNALLMQHVRLLTQTGQPSPVPTYVWGARGVGKTHVLKAIEALAQSRGERVGWLGASSAHSVAFDPQWRWILMDDVHLYDTLQQHTAFNWLVQAIHPPVGQSHVVIACGDLPPAQLHLREDVRSRLSWGHVFELQGLHDEAAADVLRHRAKAMGIRLTDELIAFILSRFSRNLSSQLELLQQLDAYALQQQRPITIPLLRSMMENME
ncbi:MAG: DnaA regulatory inactivator Hda [Betaproteobacteria bacterium]|jgi:DnaA family protein|nr:DnaA regulatory inactivator Hda [Betaproteobacteria bacterium]NBP44062.1 DnaA regulatory inactivator Hda [Betaproteobacteria bacterium]